jgi:hypothetical protein
LVVLSSPLVFNQRSQIADLALKTRLPIISIFTSRQAAKQSAPKPWPEHQAAEQQDNRSQYEIQVHDAAILAPNANELT